MRWDRASDKYVPVEWATAFDEIGRELRATQARKRCILHVGAGIAPRQRLCMAFLRVPTATTICPTARTCAHETTSVALPESIGVPVGTCTLDDFSHTDCIFFLRPECRHFQSRMLHDLQEAAKRAVPIVTFNPLRERGLVEFVNPSRSGNALSSRRHASPRNTKSRPAVIRRPSWALPRFFRS